MPAAKHDKALDLTEEALDKLADGDDKAADKLIHQAEKLDPNAPREVLQDLDEDAIHQKAYQIWDDAGRPDGKHQEHWEQARREVSGTKSS